MPGVAQSSPRKLNVLFIVVDDLNNALGAYGHPLVKTPNIDRLARRGVRFDRAYNQYPLCNPSRSSFLSGRRPDTTQVFGNDKSPRATLGQIDFLPEYFHRHGYFTAHAGKLADPFEKVISWDQSIKQTPGPNAPLMLGFYKSKASGSGVMSANVTPDGGSTATKPDQLVEWLATNTKDEDEPDGRTARRVAELMEQHRDQPFFLAAGFYRPHLPFVVPQKYFDMYPPERIQLPQEPPDDRADIPPAALTKTPSADKLSDAQKRQAIAGYYAGVSFLDAQVGVLLETMDRLKLWENTVVVFFGDHGYHLNEHGLWRKQTLFEESARIPLLIVAPDGKAGAASPRLVESVDLYPTLVDLCGLPAPDGLEGTSLRPLLKDPHRAWKKAAFTQVSRGKVMGRSVRSERYRYTEWGDEKTAELYDHQTDPHEFRNLVNDPQHAKTLAEMKRLLREGWRGALPPTARK